MNMGHAKPGEPCWACGGGECVQKYRRTVEVAPLGVDTRSGPVDMNLPRLQAVTVTTKSEPVRVVFREGSSVTLDPEREVCFDAVYVMRMADGTIQIFGASDPAINGRWRLVE